MCYMSMGANGWPLSQHGRNKIFKVSPHEALSSKTESKCRESRSTQEIKQWARPQIEL
jgi:hypothetical protein